MRLSTYDSFDDYLSDLMLQLSHVQAFLCKKLINIADRSLMWEFKVIILNEFIAVLVDRIICQVLENVLEIGYVGGYVVICCKTGKTVGIDVDS